MDFSYPKHEKLKSKTTIDLLFTEGKSVSKYPLRLVFMPAVFVEKEHPEQKLKMGVSVSKKYFKKAVDRNYYKRLLREAYRLNKHLIIDNLNKQYVFMLFYQSKEPANFKEINIKTVELFEKFVIFIKNKNT